MRRTVTLNTPLSVEETRHRLGQALERSVSGPRPVGRVEAFTARLRWKAGLNNPFRTELALVFEPEDEDRKGVVLHGVSDVTALGRLLLIGMICMVIGMTVAAGLEAGVASFLPWGLLAAGAASVGAVYVVGREVARSEHDRLIDVLIRTLDARVVATRDGADRLN